MTDRHAKGMEVRRAVLGDAHVDRAEAAATGLDAPFQRLITEAAWGTVWASDALSRRERSMLTLALLAGLGNHEELELHLRATARTGTSAEDVMEVFQHVAIYAGVPRANSAIRIAKRVFAETEGGA
jgi:4-carboxymuconolactone decarboxylase